jgi:thiol-disulfide isomerase/thioredoxin
MLMPHGTQMPAFRLLDTITGKVISSEELLGKVTVILFLANSCPFVRHLHAGLAEFGRFVRARQGQNLVAINSNDVSVAPAEAPELMGAMARDLEWVFPYCYDETQEVAEAFRAACTPDVFVFDSDGRLGYLGQFDRARPSKQDPVTGWDARSAVMDLLKEGLPSTEPKPSSGSPIRWKLGRGDFSALPAFPTPEPMRDKFKEREEEKRRIAALK